MCERNNNEEKPSTIESAVDVIGEWSPLQKRLLTFYMLVYIISPFQNLGIIFMAPKLKYWCVKPPGFENVTLENECRSYENATEPCTKWEYDKSLFWSTIVSEFDLVCQRSWFSSVAASTYQVGYAVSAIFFGVISDKYGRRFALKISIYMEIVSGFSQAFSVSLYHFLFSRFFLGISAYGRYFTGYLLIFECFGKKNRAPIAAFIEFGWLLGKLLLPLVFYLIPHFRYVQLIISTCEIFCLFWFHWLPESPRWQIVQGRFEESAKAMSDAVQKEGKMSETEFNRRLLLLKEHIDKEEEHLKQERKHTLLDLWKTKNMLKYCLVLYLNCFSNGFVNYGISYSIGVFGGNLFISLFLLAIADIVSNFGQMYVLKKWPRLPVLTGSLICSAICCFFLSTVLWFNLSTTYRMIIAMIIPLSGGFSFRLAYILSTEIIPTSMRQLGVGSCTVAIRIGSIIAPFVREFSAWTHPAVSMGVFGALLIIDASVVCFLPETKGIEIPDTLHEAANIAKKQKESVNEC